MTFRNHWSFVHDTLEPPILILPSTSHMLRPTISQHLVYDIWGMKEEACAAVPKQVPSSLEGSEDA